MPEFTPAHALPRAGAKEETLQLHQSLTQIQKSALEPSTQRGYASWVRNYEAFCQSTDPVTQAWPPTSYNLGLFCVRYCRDQKRTGRSLSNALSAFKDHCMRFGYDWLDDRESWLLERTRRGLMKLDRTAPARKQPMTRSRLLELRAFSDPSNPAHHQYVSMSYVARDGLLRCKELLNLRRGDVTLRPNGHVSLLIRVSKTTHTRPAETVQLSNYGPSSGAQLLRVYCRDFLHWDISQPAPMSLADCYLFPAVSHTGPGVFSLSSREPKKDPFVAWIRECMRKAGHQPSNFSGHSFRSGGATDLFTAGASLRTIQLKGRWASQAFLLYIRDKGLVSEAESAAAFALLEASAQRSPLADPLRRIIDLCSSPPAPSPAPPRTSSPVAGPPAPILHPLHYRRIAPSLPLPAPPRVQDTPPPPFRGRKRFRPRGADIFH